MVLYLKMPSLIPVTRLWPKCGRPLANGGPSLNLNNSVPSRCDTLRSNVRSCFQPAKTCSSISANCDLPLCSLPIVKLNYISILRGWRDILEDRVAGGVPVHVLWNNLVHLLVKVGVSGGAVFDLVAGQ